MTQTTQALGKMSEFDFFVKVYRSELAKSDR